MVMATWRDENKNELNTLFTSIDPQFNSDSFFTKADTYWTAAGNMFKDIKAKQISDLEKQIAATEKEVEEYKKKKNIVSSQPKKEATKKPYSQMEKKERQDLLNHFHIRQGERLMNPSFGTIIWDLLFEPLTEDVKSAIIENVNTIINYDPRIKADRVTVTAYESGIQIECFLTFMPYNISQSMQLRFDQANGLLAQ
jgi:phage baseplate assembly protein W